MKIVRTIGIVAVATACQAGSGAERTPSAQPADAVPASWPYHLDTPAVTAPHGMVVTDAPLATHVGADMLRRGGNAIDAAVATAFALAVVWPAAGNVGGGGFIVAQMVGSPPVALDFREMAPAAATRDMFI